VSATGQQRIKALNYSRSQRILTLTFSDDIEFKLSAEFLRVFSPSAEVRGHGPGQEVLQTGKSSVAIAGIEPVGHYAVQISFDDDHDSGLYSWSYLRDLAEQQDRYWQSYLQQLEAAGQTREADIQVLHFTP
jgi:DUF971 family protein